MRPKSCPGFDQPSDDDSIAAGPAPGRPCPTRSARPADVRVFVDLDAVLLSGIQDLPPGALLGRFAFEIGLIEAGDRVPHVRLVVDRYVFPALRVDIRELCGAEPVAVLRVEFRHGASPCPGGIDRRTAERAQPGSPFPSNVEPSVGVTDGVAVRRREAMREALMDVRRLGW